MKRKFVFLLCFVILISPALAFSEDTIISSPLKDPGINSGERAVYRVESEEGVFLLKDNVEISEDGRYYIVESYSRTTKKVLMISRNTMFPVKLDIFADKSDYRIRSIKKVYYKKKLKGNAIPVISNFDSRFALRGFPFEKPRVLVIDFLTDDGGTRSSGFEISVHFAGEEDIDTGSRKIPCYVLEIRYKARGIVSLFKNMFPQTKVWYSIQEPHYMVKYENKGGQSENGDVIILITDYSGWE